TTIEENILVFFFTCRQGIGSITSLIDHKNPHLHIVVDQSFTDPLLLGNGSSHHPVVLDRPESLVCHKFDLINKILPCMIFKHSVVGSVHKIERFTGDGGLSTVRLKPGGQPQAGSPEKGVFDKISAFHKVLSNLKIDLIVINFLAKLLLLRR